MKALDWSVARPKATPAAGCWARGGRSRARRSGGQGLGPWPSIACAVLFDRRNLVLASKPYYGRGDLDERSPQEQKRGRGSSRLALTRMHGLGRMRPKVADSLMSGVRFSVTEQLMEDCREPLTRSKAFRYRLAWRHAGTATVSVQPSPSKAVGEALLPVEAHAPRRDFPHSAKP